MTRLVAWLLRRCTRVGHGQVARKLLFDIKTRAKDGTGTLGLVEYRWAQVKGAVAWVSSSQAIASVTRGVDGPGFNHEGTLARSPRDAVCSRAVTPRPRRRVSHWPAGALLDGSSLLDPRPSLSVGAEVPTLWRVRFLPSAERETATAC